MDTKTYSFFMYDQIKEIEKYCEQQSRANPSSQTDELALDWISQYAGIFRKQWLSSHAS